MANRYAVATGNWSNTATWDGGTTLPTAGDVVRPSGFTVTIDQDITVGSLRSDASAPAVMGGTFVTSGNRVVTADVVAGGGGSVLLTQVASTTLTINGNLSGPVTGAASSRPFLASANCTYTINGNVTAGSGITWTGLTDSTGCVGAVNGNIQGSSGIYSYGANITGTLVVTGNVTGGGAAQGYGLLMQTGANVTVNGNVSGGTSVTTIGIECASSGSSTTIVNGNVTGGSGNSSFGVDVYGTVTINGNVTGGPSGGSAYGVNMAGGSCRIVGNIQGNGSSGYGVNHTIGVLDVEGIVKTPLMTCPVSINNSGMFNQIGRFAGTIERYGMAWAPNYVPHSTLPLQIATKADNLFPGDPTAAADKYLSMLPANQPATADVREGTTYGAGGTNTGTLAVPAAGSVALGVPVDAGTGSAVLNAEDIWGADPNDFEPNTIGDRLRHVSTVDTVGEQFTAALTTPQE